MNAKPLYSTHYISCSVFSRAAKWRTVTVSTTRWARLDSLSATRRPPPTTMAYISTCQLDSIHDTHIRLVSTSSSTSATSLVSLASGLASPLLLSRPRSSRHTRTIQRAEPEVHKATFNLQRKVVTDCLTWMKLTTIADCIYCTQRHYAQTWKSSLRVNGWEMLTFTTRQTQSLYA